MASVVELEAMRDKRLKARFAGVRTVEYEGRRVTYASEPRWRRRSPWRPRRA